MLEKQRGHLDWLILPLCAFPVVTFSFATTVYWVLRFPSGAVLASALQMAFTEKLQNRLVCDTKLTYFWRVLNLERDSFLILKGTNTRVFALFD